MLSDFEKFPLIEEYLRNIAEGQLYTGNFDALDTAPKRRLTTRPLKMEVGNPFQRPLNSGNDFPLVPGSYMDMDGQRL